MIPVSPDIQWPPPAADINPIVYDTSVWSELFVSLKSSISAMASTGFVVFCIVVSCVLVPFIVRRMVSRRRDGALGAADAGQDWRSLRRQARWMRRYTFWHMSDDIYSSLSAHDDNGLDSYPQRRYRQHAAEYYRKRGQ